MRSPRASAAVGDSPSARAQAGVQLSPRGLPDSPTSLLPRSPLVSHDGKADAAWAEADARAAQEKQPPAKRFLLTRSGDSLSGMTSMPCHAGSRCGGMSTGTANAA